MHSPLISCVCVTKKELKLPISCFKKQTYPNVELIIVHEQGGWVHGDSLPTGDDPTQYEIVLSDPKIHLEYVPKEPRKLTLGELYNKGVNAAAGEFVIIWDGDDWHHPERVEQQYKMAEKNFLNKCIMLERWYMWDFLEKEPYLSGRRQWEGSLLAPKRLLQKHPYPAMGKGTDTKVLIALSEHEGGVGTMDEPELYVYALHDENICGREHGNYLKQQGEKLPTEHNWFETLFEEAQQYELPLHKEPDSDGESWAAVTDVEKHVDAT